MDDLSDDLVNRTVLEPETENTDLLPPKNISNVSTSLVTKKELRAACKTQTSLDQTKIDLRTSLQQCELQGLVFLLNYRLQEAKRLGYRKKEQKLKGLLEIHSHLMLKPDFGYARHIGYIDFNIAYELYCGHLEHSVDHKEFRDILLHPEYGLCVYIVNFLESNKRYIVLKTETLDLPNFIVELNTAITSIEDPPSQANSTRLTIDKNSLQCILSSMDSEWDRKCAKVIIGANLSRKEMEELGFHPETLTKSVENVKTIVEETERTKIAARDCIMLRLRGKEERLKAQLEECNSIIEKKEGVWQDHRINEVRDQMDIAKEQIDENKMYIDCLEKPDEADKYVKQKVQQRIKRTAENLAESHRMKKRKLGAGPSKQLDSSDEEFMAKAIEDKATYHGRRHNPVMFTNRRVKKRDLLSIANYRLLQKGKKMIKSATTPWNRSRPRNIRSRQARLHIGKGIFCTKKPPKAEDCDNENTHHQRSHCKNVQQFLSSNNSNRKFSFMKSMDDKAYIRPGTSEGLEKTRNMKILTLTGEGARKLPKYDWPEKAVYQTPAAHRIMDKEAITMDDGSEKLITVNDVHVVVVRPKAYVPSSGSTWANETHRLRCLYPDVHEVQPEDHFVKYSPDIRRFCATLYGDVYLLNDMTEEEDVKKLTESGSRPHQEYELKRLSHFLHRIDICSDAIDTKKDEISKPDFELIKNIKSFTTPRINHCTKIVDQLKMGNRPETDTFKELQALAHEVLKHLNSLTLSPVKPRWAEFTDAGPGVGVNNLEVKVRSAELDRIYDRDYRIRVHRSRGDSGQNEAERTNSAIGDAVVDGATIEWEHYKRFQGMTKEEVSCLSIQDFDAYEAQRMETNAWRVTHQLTERIDGAPVLSEFISSVASESPNDTFFFNDSYLADYVSKSKNLRNTVPGAAYLNKIFSFIDLHVQTGELYTEFLKGSCKNTHGSLCQYCSENSWIGPTMNRIPRPIPDADALPEYRYKSVNNTPLTDSNGNERVPDDWQPRSNIKKLFEQKKLSIEDADAIKEFSQKFIVDEKLVKSYLEHLSSLEAVKNIRQKEREVVRQERHTRDVSDYKWQELVENCKLASLTVAELDKYLVHHKLCKKGKKKDKIRRITAHYYMKSGEAMPEDKLVATGERVASTDGESESDSEDDLIYYKSSTSDDSSSYDGELDEAEPPVQQTTRSGRTTGHWTTRYADFVI